MVKHVLHKCVTDISVSLAQTFTTQETITNATSAKEWLLKHSNDVCIYLAIMSDSLPA